VKRSLGLIFFSLALPPYEGGGFREQVVIARDDEVEETLRTRPFSDLGLDRSPPDLSDCTLMPLHPARLSDVIPSSALSSDLGVVWAIHHFQIAVPISKRLHEA
jgi:hypothetical protein